MTHLVLQLGELIAHGDKKLAVSLALVCREGEDAGKVVAILTALLLAEVPGGRRRGRRMIRDEPLEGLSAYNEIR